MVEYQKLEEAEEEAQIKARRLSSEGLEVTQGPSKTRIGLWGYSTCGYNKEASASHDSLFQLRQLDPNRTPVALNGPRALNPAPIPLPLLPGSGSSLEQPETPGAA